MSEQQEKLSAEEISKIHDDAIKMQFQAQEALNKYNQKECEAQQQGQELSKFEKIMKGINKFALMMGAAVEKKADELSRKQR